MVVVVYCQLPSRMFYQSRDGPRPAGPMFNIGSMSVSGTSAESLSHTRQRARTRRRGHTQAARRDKY